MKRIDKTAYNIILILFSRSMPHTHTHTRFLWPIHTRHNLNTSVVLTVGNSDYFITYLDLPTTKQMIPDHWWLRVADYGNRNLLWHRYCVCVNMSIVRVCLSVSGRTALDHNYRDGRAHEWNTPVIAGSTTKTSHTKSVVAFTERERKLPATRRAVATRATVRDLASAAADDSAALPRRVLPPSRPVASLLCGTGCGRVAHSTERTPAVSAPCGYILSSYHIVLSRLLTSRERGGDNNNEGERGRAINPPLNVFHLFHFLF